MQRRTRPLLPIFAAVATVTVASTLIVYWAGTRVTATGDKLLRNDAIQDTLDNTLSTLKDAETGQRGFLLVGDPKYIEPYDAAAGRIGQDLEQLRRWAAAGDVSPEDVAVLDRLVQEKLDELKLTTELQRGGSWEAATAGLRSAIGRRIVEALGGTAALPRTQGHEAALAVVKLGVGKQVMDDLRARLADIDARQQRQADYWRRQRQQAVTLRTVLAVSMGVVELVFLWWAWRRLSRAHEEQRAAGEALRASNERLKKVLEVETVGVMFWDLTTGCLVDANDTFLKMMGYSRSDIEARNLTWQKFTPPEYYEVSRAEVAKFMATGRVGPYEKEYFCKDGSRRWLLFAGSSLGNNACVEFCVDIAERKHAEAALRESEQRFRTLADAITQLAWWANADGYITWYNRRWYEYTGTTPKDMEGWGWQSVHDPKALPAVMERWKASIATGEPFDMVFPLRGADGKFRPFLTRIRPIKDAQGRVVQWFGTNTDVEELKRAEEAQTRLAAIVEFSEDAILSKTLDGTILSWNGGAERLFGYAAEEIIGKPITVLIPPERVAEEEQILARLRQGERIEHYETIRVATGGRRIDVLVTISPLKDRNGQIIGASKIIHDITDRKRAEKELRQLKDELEVRVQKRTADLEAANREMEAFSYTVSHDLRAPLRHITGFVQLLEHSAGSRLDDKGRRHVQIISDAAQRMGDLIDDLLGLSRIGRTSMTMTEVDLRPLVDDALRELSPVMQGRAIDWKIGPLPQVRGDRLLLRSAMVNLLSNAIKYTRPRRPALIEIGSEQQDGEVICFVRDNGVGFDMRFVDKLFGVFHRLHRMEDFEGTGIGLASVRRIIQRHGGRTWAEGVVDGGATFYFSLPNERRSDS